MLLAPGAIVGCHVQKLSEKFILKTCEIRVHSDFQHSVCSKISSTDFGIQGSPGVRNDGNYYAYVRDIDGNKIAAKCISN